MNIHLDQFTANGHSLAYRSAGKGTLLVILPGNTSSSAWHEGELNHFGKRCHTVAMDFVGTGRSQRLDPWPLDWWQQAARDALALVEVLGEEQAILMGTSGGAVAALWAAIFAPERVRAVIADSCGEHIEPERLRAEIANRQQKTPAQAAFWEKAHGPDWEQVVAADNRICLALAERGGDWFEGRLGEIRCPVLFTASLQDDLLPGLGEQLPRMAAQVVNGRVLLCGEGTHPWMGSRPHEFRAVADAFMSLVEAGFLSTISTKDLIG